MRPAVYQDDVVQCLLHIRDHSRPELFRHGRPPLTELYDNWSPDWLWSLPLIVLTVVGHSFGLLLIASRGTVTFVSRARGFGSSFGVTMSTIVLLIILLHSVEGIPWAAVYLCLGALPGPTLAMLYSLEAMTIYGHSDIKLAARRRLMGALEPLNGMILFGLTIAFLFNVVQRTSASGLVEGGMRSTHEGALPEARAGPDGRSARRRDWAKLCRSCD